MLFRLLTTALLITQMVAWWNATPITAVQISPHAGTDDFHLYLPAVKHELPLKLVVTTGLWTGDVPGSYYMYGYVLNTSTQPMYSVTLNATVVITRSFDHVVYTQTWTSRPLAFKATLPGQPNPFALSIFQGRTETFEFRAVSLQTAASQGPSDPTYVALDASHYALVDDGPFNRPQITGTIRNDTNRSISDIHVVIVPDCVACALLEAQVSTRALQPGETMIYYSEYYEKVPLRFPPLAQGMIAP